MGSQRETGVFGSSRAMRPVTWMASVLLALAIAMLAASSASAATSGTAEVENAVVSATCKSVTVTYRNFPNANANTVIQTLTIHGQRINMKKIVFNGPTETNEQTIAVPPGAGAVDIHANWKTNGVSGAFDLGVPLECPPEPELSITKLQKIEGTTGAFTTAPLIGKIGQVVDYEIIVSNTGNVPLVLSNFIDEHCEKIAGGPGTTPVKIRENTTYTCSQPLTAVGTVTNAATVSGTSTTQPETTVTKTSNTVEATVLPEPSYTIEKLQEILGSGTGYTKKTLVGETGQTIDYEVVVKNTGNVPLTFENFTDESCEGVTGGPSGPVAPGETATYFCSRLINETPAQKPEYINTATVTGTPPPGSGPITQTSNPVRVVRSPTETGTEENEHVTVSSTCHYVTFTWKGFPNKPNNTVSETLTIHGKGVFKMTFTFNGPEATQIFKITVPPGPGNVDLAAHWNTNGVMGSFDVGVPLECPAEPEFSIRKYQRLEGTSSFTTNELHANTEQTVEYEIVATNDGNVPLTFTSFTDEGCESIAGGPGAATIAPGKSTTWTCKYKLGPTQETHDNTASASAKQTHSLIAAFTRTSNTVVAKSTEIQ